MKTPQPRNPLHGVTLEAMLTELVAYFGWPELGERIQIRSFNVDPSIPSSLKFLRKTPWAREKVEGLYLFMHREQARHAPRKPSPTTAQFGSWASPISAGLIAGSTIRLGQVQLQGAHIYWSEGRPQEQGRNVVVQCHPDSQLTDVNPAPFNVRSTAHEYGGGAFVPLADGLVFCHFADQQLYRIGPSGTASALTHDAAMRYADMVADPSRQRLVAVREDHSQHGEEARSSLVAIDLHSGTAQVLVEGSDFYSSPRISPDGQQLAWLSWDHPNMPWDGCTLWLADLSPEGLPRSVRAVAGSQSESIFQPEWSPRGELHFVADRSGWWNLYRLRDGQVHALCPMEAEFGVPQWAFGMSTYGFDGQGHIVCTYTQNGRSQLARLNTETLQLEPLATPYCAISELKVGTDFAAFIGGSETAPESVIRIDLGTLHCEPLRSASTASLEVSTVSRAQAISFPTEGGCEAHAFYYPPLNPAFISPSGSRPPLLVFSHGGPTGATTAAFKWNIQFWTSRGFAVVDVNYGGSSGYGRAYRERLNGQWGVVDVDDAVNAAKHLIERGAVDAERIAIRGSSAGGYTTLSALTFRRFFQCGASHYGIGDLEALVRDTHKFESRYLDRLIGPYPEQQALYAARSPVNFTHQLSAPMILLQGLEDKAVPPAQAQAMFDAVRAKGLPVALLMFEGEQHGFRRAETIQRALEAELYFYGRVFGFSPADAIEPVPIENL